MERAINRDQLLLSQPAVAATRADQQVVTDLLDTLAANSDRCVGMAANMIGVNKNVIVVRMGPVAVPMINPRLTHLHGPFTTKEGCLSLDGERETVRYQSLDVDYLDAQWRPQHQHFSGWVAQIIQHEVDHTQGRLI
ncbi:peptide deformylase [Lacticaseibacillus thailandensis]|uniref:Peptide deformylase n=1 Tax=Lacticaseibacillus thailandensis DSM 22698 = JCM 13996 TaxID=1423810 RepID=A0A0R2C883_9LACO|nr:peptide deformylase [Lacticaseibacillus thailandensis]KRM87218.1 peptide deformylase [Lacticaseibacillus thailandensis DSM 22698 = JCM 13996]